MHLKQLWWADLSPRLRTSVGVSR